MRYNKIISLLVSYSIVMGAVISQVAQATDSTSVSPPVGNTPAVSRGYVLASGISPMMLCKGNVVQQAGSWNAGSGPAQRNDKGGYAGNECNRWPAQDTGLCAAGTYPQLLTSIVSDNNTGGSYATRGYFMFAEPQQLDPAYGNGYFVWTYNAYGNVIAAGDALVQFQWQIICVPS